jgi:hypothetical protein
MNISKVSSHVPRSAKYLWMQLQKSTELVVRADIQECAEYSENHDDEEGYGEECVLRSPYGEVHDFDGPSAHQLGF